MRIPDGGYDFDAADILESTLNTAAGKLSDLATQRGTWAWKYLRYQTVSGQQQGWVGSDYSAWATQFGTSQNGLADFARQLLQQAFNVHNASYDRDLAENGTTRRTRMQRPASLPSAASAPPNPNLDGAEAATPDLLYQYSNMATGFNDQVRPYISSTLVWAADISPTGGLTCQELAQCIAAWLRNKLLELDARVRIIGRAFEIAGGNPAAPLGPGPVPGSPPGETPYSSMFLTVPGGKTQLDQTISTIVGQDETDATAAQQAARQYVNGDDTLMPQLLQQISDNANNPAWTSAFFSSLTEQQIEDLILQLYRVQTYRGYAPDIAQALTTALDASGMSKAAISGLITAFTGGSGGPDFNQDLLADLQADPEATVNFIQGASDQQLQDMLNGGDESAIINLLTVTLANEPDQADADMFYARVRELIFSTHPGSAASVTQAVGSFVATYIDIKFPPPPPGTTGDAFDQWRDSTASQMGQLVGPWVDWLSGIAQADNVPKDAIRSTIENFATSIAVWSLGLPSIAGTVAGNVGESLIQPQLDQAIDYILPQLDDEDVYSAGQAMAVAQLAVTERHLITSMLQDNQIVMRAGDPPDQHDVPVPANADTYMEVWNYLSGKGNGTEFYLANTNGRTPISTEMEAFTQRYLSTVKLY